MSKRKINEIIVRKLFGKEFTEEEQRYLEERMLDDSFKKKYESLLEENGAEIVRRYREYKAVPEMQPLAESGKNRVVSMRRVVGYAAAILALLVAGAAFWYSQYTKVTPPEIPASVQLAMQHSRESGKQEAVSEELSVTSEEWETETEKISVKNEGYEGKSDDKKYNARKDKPSLSTLHATLTKDQLMSARRITTWHDKEFWLTLDDGTLVHLNYNTRLIYPERFGRGNRNVILEGEAYFMVAKDRSRPFVVHTTNGDIKVYGTEFNVNTSEPSKTTVVLVKGSVSVRPTGGKEQRMKPGQQCEFSSVESQLSTVNVAPYIAWNTGDFIFHGWTLRHIMDVMSKWYNVTVEFSSESIANQIFTGSFSRYDDIRSTIETIKDVTGHEITIINNHISIKE